jgi:nanoRNase/pAp phosphatase (c-di-AMP/oligoRNAs hydrolase)
VVNCAYFFSEACAMLLERYPDAPFSAYYFDRADGLRQWGLRSIGSFDVSKIAAKFGGGGHRNAAGFQTPI